MGHIELPPQGKIYVDSNIIIYTVENHPKYIALLRPLWTASESGAITVCCSELAIVEVLTAPLRYSDALLTQAYTRALFETEIKLLPITREILLSAARIRATQPSIRTPDAI
ncbi:MAG: PIN domain-containing protein, partial [bacterium]|nr:PIN domain-containing protein [bacterium]